MIPSKISLTLECPDTDKLCVLHIMKRIPHHQSNITANEALPKYGGKTL